MLKELGICLIAVSALVLPGCRAGQPAEKVGTEFYRAHEKIFGCPPVDADCYLVAPKVPERSLDAVEDNCGKPVYKRPACNPPCPPKESSYVCTDGSCNL